MVILAEKVQKRHGDFFQIHFFSAHKHFVLNQQIVFVAVFHKLAEGFPGDVGAVEDPALHAHEVFHEIPIVHVFHEADVLVDHQTGGVEQQEAEIHQIAGNIAEGADHPIRVHVLHPDVQQAFVRVEVGRRDGGDQVFDFFRMQRGVNDAKGSAHADAHQIDFGDAVFPPDEIHNIVHVAVDMIVNGQETILAGGIAPVHHVQVDAFLQKRFHDASVRLQVQHRFAVDQRVHHQQRDVQLVFRLFVAGVVLEADAVFFVHDFIRRRSDFVMEFTQQDVGGAGNPLPGLFSVFGHSFQNQIQGNFCFGHENAILPKTFLPVRGRGGKSLYLTTVRVLGDMPAFFSSALTLFLSR
ncbi:MAG: hypothetical protein BWX45_00513 [Deltaproteobacteria bacterium ADurb.Bin002]|nr:MAG: hypothetical protein BWX45_00513 [Deltaproteobacteria bacterium ADurb.Bin002]